MPRYQALIEVTRADPRAPFLPALIWLYDRDAGAITLLTLASAPSRDYADRYLAGLEPTEGQPTMDELWDYWTWHGGGNGPFTLRQPTDPFEADDLVLAMIHAVELAGPMVPTPVPRAPCRVSPARIAHPLP